MINFFLSLLNIQIRDILSTTINKNKHKSKFFHLFRNNKNATLSGMVL